MSTPEVPVEERMVGYDAREYWVNFEERWPEPVRQSYLYRLDVLKPLSVDTLVWPTIFEAEGRAAPTGFNGFKDFWADFFELQAAVTRAYQEKPMRAWRMVAATLLLGAYCKDDDVPWSSRMPPANPAERGTNWEFVGYDVADQWMLSGLSNCGFLPGAADVQVLRAEWGPRLNKFHLFRTFDDAVRFKHFSDRRLPDDHAPFFVYGLWIVK
jgi:hypothetical protein